MLIDSHCHLNYKEYHNITHLLDFSLESGVDTFIAIGASDGMESCRETVELSKKSDSIFPTIGIHPHDAKLYNNDIDKELRYMFSNNNIVAVGEIGLDYYYDHSPKDIQKEIFKKQLSLAVDFNLPIIIHTRDAEKDTINILKEFRIVNKDIKILFHCFSGSSYLAEEGLKLGNTYFSFSGILTFKKAQEIRDIAKTIPLDKILVETDSPYLTPTPFRGKTNHPAYVKYVAEKLAEIKEVEYNSIVKVTRENTISFFNLPIK